jgi:formate dehydrogenase subunit delta
MSSTEQRGAAHDGAPNEGGAHGGQQSLVKMANDIGHFFRAEPKREDAIAGIANHISKFWTRRMQEKLLAQVQSGDAGLEELPREALKTLQSAAPPRPALPQK